MTALVALPEALESVQKAKADAAEGGLRYVTP